MTIGSLKLDILLYPSKNFCADADLIGRAESLGYDAAWIADSGGNPFFALTIAAAETQRIGLGAWSAHAFPRSPMVTAQIAWDLARQSAGRFVLGLDSGLRSRVDSPGGTESQSQLGRMREYIESLRAIWDTFQTDARLRFRGEHYTFRLMAPFFNPGPIDQPDIPIFLTGADSTLGRLAGELCQGWAAPALHTQSYLSNELLPALVSGLKSAERERLDVELAAPVIVVSGQDEAELQRAKHAAKRQIANLARSPANRGIISYLGWEETVDELKAIATSKRWEMMPNTITDDALSEVAIIAEPQDIRARIQERYAGVVDRVCVCVGRENAGLIETIMSA